MRLGLIGLKGHQGVVLDGARQLGNIELATFINPAGLEPRGQNLYTETVASGNPVTFAAEGSCSVEGGSVQITGAGSCTIIASQAGNSNYNAWQVVESAWVAKTEHLTPFVGAQNQYNLLQRDIEKELVPGVVGPLKRLVP